MAVLHKSVERQSASHVYSIAFPFTYFSLSLAFIIYLYQLKIQISRHGVLGFWGFGVFLDS